MGELPLGVGGAFYINLNHRTDRRAEVEGEMERIGIACERFEAIQRRPGIVGCNYSHIAVLKEAQRRGYESVLIFEDDFQFLVDKDTFWSTMSAIRDEAKNYDVIMLSYNLQVSRPHSSNLLRVIEAATTSGYVVHSRMYAPLIEIFEKATPELERTGKHWIYALDQAWKILQPQSEWFATKLRIGLQRPSYSDIGGKFTDNQC